MSTQIYLCVCRIESENETKTRKKMKINVNIRFSSDALDGFGITECGSLACLSNPCRNGAICIEVNEGRTVGVSNIKDMGFSSSSNNNNGMHETGAKREGGGGVGGGGDFGTGGKGNGGSIWQNGYGDRDDIYTQIMENDNKQPKILDKWKCRCPTGYMGSTCEISVCDDNPCQYGATCVTFPGSGYLCLCPFGKHGHYCEHSK